VNLLSAQYIGHCQEGAYVDVRESLFLAFAGGTLFERLAVLHETGRHGPITPPGLDSATA
jgi:hypothetical protein